MVSDTRIGGSFSFPGAAASGTRVESSTSSKAIASGARIKDSATSSRSRPLHSSRPEADPLRINYEDANFRITSNNKVGRNYKEWITYLELYHHEAHHSSRTILFGRVYKGFERKDQLLFLGQHPTSMPRDGGVISPPLEMGSSSSEICFIRTAMAPITIPFGFLK